MVRDTRPSTSEAGGRRACPPRMMPVLMGTTTPTAKLINLTRHVSTQLEPCLCTRCLPQAPREFEVKGEKFVRRSVVVKHRELHFWAPAALADSKAMAKSVASGMRRVRERQKRSAVAPEPSSPPVHEEPPAQKQPSGAVGFLKRLIGK